MLVLAQFSINHNENIKLNTPHLVIAASSDRLDALLITV
jgi:hypothetical protein